MYFYPHQCFIYLYIFNILKFIVCSYLHDSIINMPIWQIFHAWILFHVFILWLYIYVPSFFLYLITPYPMLKKSYLVCRYILSFTYVRANHAFPWYMWLFSYILFDYLIICYSYYVLYYLSFNSLHLLDETDWRGICIVTNAFIDWYFIWNIVLDKIILYKRSSHYIYMSIWIPHTTSK